MRVNVSLLCIALVFVPSCKPTDRDGRIIRPSDAWLRDPPSEFITSAKEVSPEEFAQVTTAKEQGALARLNDSACVEVTAKEAEVLVGRPIEGTGGRLVLLRALRWDTNYGRFTLTRRTGEVRVTHGCLGRNPLPVIRCAIVARLSKLPTEVYVGLEMAE
jgi:hypothetical protein